MKKKKVWSPRGTPVIRIWLRSSSPLHTYPIISAKGDINRGPEGDREDPPWNHSGASHLKPHGTSMCSHSCAHCLRMLMPASQPWSLANSLVTAKSERGRPRRCKQLKPALQASCRMQWRQRGKKKTQPLNPEI